jgi:hypothetical protein
MEVCFHAGLHKSGTTTVQQCFAREFGTRNRIWYPLLDGPHRGHHAPLIWPLLGREDDVVSDTPSLSEIIHVAEESGVGQLVISAEALDFVGPPEVELLRAAIGERVVRVVFTVTQPQHRWASGWQELVKHSLGAAPIPARQRLLRLACLEPGRLEELVTIFPADVKTIILVRRDRPDPALVSTVASALNLPWAHLGEESVLNRGIGGDIALLAHLNSIGATSGVTSRRSAEEFDQQRQQASGKRIDQFAQWEFDLPSELVAAATAEVDFLQRSIAGDKITVVDTAELLNVWENHGLPEWYRALADGSTGPGGLLQDPAIIDLQMSTAKHRARVENQLDEVVHSRNVMAEQLQGTIEQLRRVTQELQIVRRSRSLRLATSVRAAVRRTKSLVTRTLGRLR